MSDTDGIAALEFAARAAGLPVSPAGLIRETHTARLLGVGERTVRRWRHDASGPVPTKIGSRWWYSIEALATYLAETGQTRPKQARPDIDRCDDRAQNVRRMSSKG